ncbi:hypothetical protein A2U01_0081417, partial [Trifolium medium]|nr:hypothetical protein [Trifolium medium]
MCMKLEGKVFDAQTPCVLDWATSWPKSHPARHLRASAPARYDEPAIML